VANLQTVQHARRRSHRSTSVCTASNTPTPDAAHAHGEHGRHDHRTQTCAELYARQSSVPHPRSASIGHRRLRAQSTTDSSGEHADVGTAPRQSWGGHVALLRYRCVARHDVPWRSRRRSAHSLSQQQAALAHRQSRVSPVMWRRRSHMQQQSPPPLSARVALGEHGVDERRRLFHQQRRPSSGFAAALVRGELDRSW